MRAIARKMVRSRKCEIQNVRHRVGIRSPAAPNDPKTRQAKSHAAVEQGPMLAANILGKFSAIHAAASIKLLPVFLDRQRVAGGKAHWVLVVSGQYLRVEAESVVEGEQPIGQYVAQRSQMCIKISDARQRPVPVNSGRAQYPKIAASNYAPDIRRRYVTGTAPGYSNRAHTNHSIMGIEQRNTSGKKCRTG